MFGSMADAEDALQATYLRRHAAGREECRKKGNSHDDTTRNCRGMMTIPRARREEYAGFASSEIAVMLERSDAA